MTNASKISAQIVNQDSRLCMDIQGGSVIAGTDVIQWACTGANWQERSDDAGTGLIGGLHDPRYCLDNGGY